MEEMFEESKNHQRALQAATYALQELIAMEKERLRQSLEGKP